MVLNSEEDKEKVLNNLRNLKDKFPYKNISNTEDFTNNKRIFFWSFLGGPGPNEGTLLSWSFIILENDFESLDM